MGLRHSDIMAKLLKLQAIDYDRYTADINSLIKNTTDLTVGVSHLGANELNDLNAKLSGLLSEYKTTLDSFEKKLRTVLNDSLDSYLTMSEETWQQNIEKMTYEEHKEWSKKWPPVNHEREAFVEFCATYCTWQAPGMIYGAKFNTPLLNAVSGTDPVYLVDQFPQYLEAHKNLMPPEQIRKLRVYKADDMNLLPKEIIGVIVVYNEFPFLPWDITQSLMYKFTQLLAPGGTLIFNYNNCSTYKGFVQFEKRLMSYTTQDMFLSQAQKLGLKCTYQYDASNQPFSYMALQKPGSRNLSKRHASLGYIHQHLELKDPDTHKKRIEFIRKLVAPK